MKQHLLKTSLIVSVVVHVGLLLSFHISKYAEVKVGTPIGVQIQYAGAGAASRDKAQALVKKQKLKTVDQSDVALKNNKNQKKVKRNNSVVGQKITGQASGPRGDVNGVEVTALSRYQYEFQKFIEARMYYPSKAKKLYQTGKVLLKVEIDKTGEILNVATIKKCPFHTLNEAAIKMVKGIMKFKSFPSGMTEEKIAFILPVEYIL